MHYHFFVFCFLCIKISQSLPQNALSESIDVTVSSAHRADSGNVLALSVLSSIH